MKITLFPIKTKKGNDALIGKFGENTYFCSDMSLASGDEMLIEPSSDPKLFFLKRVASGVTVEIEES